MLELVRMLAQIFPEKSRGAIRGLTVPVLAMIAGGLVLLALPVRGQTGKSLSEADLKKIDDITQTAVKSALARDFVTWAALSK